MIIYRELSSLVTDLGFTPRALYSVSFHRNRHYKAVRIPKANGEHRELFVPDAFLKSIQRSIASVLLSHEEISPYATAYCYGSSTKKNASPHVGKPVVLKLDIRHFFDSIIYPLVKERAFPAHRYSEANRILLTLLCMHRDTLPQGAPTSPAISNIIMKDFDNTIGQWCDAHQIAFTRYCDDMTFSGDFDPKPVIELVKRELGKLGFFLNDKKTVVVRDGQRKTVTGIVVNEKLNTTGDYRRKLRQELYYCRKYGLESHILHKGLSITEEQYRHQLLGRVNYVLQITPESKEMQGYKDWLLAEKRHGGSYA